MDGQMDGQGVILREIKREIKREMGAARSHTNSLNDKDYQESGVWR